MTSEKHPARVSRAKYELCKTFAEMATVSTAFEVCPDIRRHPDGRISTDSFSVALALISGADPGSILVKFDWRAGGRGGRSEVEYSNICYPLATRQFVTKLVRKRIKREITGQLLKEAFHGYDQ